jgi:hypothetical protein
MKRIRDPRVFYGFNRELGPFDEDLATFSRLIAKLDEEKCQNLSWFGAYQLANKRDDRTESYLIGTPTII